MTLLAAPLAAHDFWLAAQPSTSNQTVTITAGVGEKFPTRTAFKSRDNWLADWRVIGDGADVTVTKSWRRDDLVMATDVVLPRPGAYLGVAFVTAQTIEMKGGEFTDYLKEEGLDQIVAARQKAGEADKATKERYARYAKIALRTGDGPGDHLVRPAGLKAEFIPATDPTRVKAGGSLAVRLVTDGKPVAQATVSAVNNGVARTLKTDASGRATFTIDRPGDWLIKTVHMVRLPAGGDIEWESFWVTLAFTTAS